MKRRDTWDLIERLERVRKVPVNLEAERALIGSLLWAGNSEFTSRVISQTAHGDETMFSSQLHVSVAMAIGRLLDQGEPIEPVSIATELGDTSGAVTPYLVEALKFASDSPKSGEYYLGAVRDAHRRREFSFAIARAEAMLADPDLGIEDAREELEQCLFEISEDKTHGYKRVRDIAPKIAEQIEKPSLQLRGVLTGITGLDNMTNGWQPGNLIVIIAKSGDGKTSLALSLAMQAALTTGVAFNSAEMQDVEIVQRMIAHKAQVNSFDIRRSNLFAEERGKVHTAINDLKHYNVFVDDQAAISPMEIKGRLRKLVLKEKIGLVVVDYFQLMSANGKYSTREQELASISRGMKQLAKDLALPVILLAQVNKDAQKRAGNRIYISDVRECEALRMDADLGLALIWDLPEHERGTVIQGEIDVQKHRGGPTGVVRVEFDRSTSTYRDAPMNIDGAIERAREWNDRFEPQRELSEGAF